MVMITFNNKILDLDNRKIGVKISTRVQLHIFYSELNFSSELGVANENLENEPKGCLAVA